MKNQLSKEEILDLLNEEFSNPFKPVVWEIEEIYNELYDNRHYYFIFTDSLSLFKVTIHYHLYPVSYYEMDINYNTGGKIIRNDDFIELLKEGFLFMKNILVSEIRLFLKLI